jgi:hypothetical protein
MQSAQRDAEERAVEPSPATMQSPRRDAEERAIEASPAAAVRAVLTTSSVQVN